MSSFSEPASSVDSNNDDINFTHRHENVHTTVEIGNRHQQQKMLTLRLNATALAIKNISPDSPLSFSQVSKKTTDTKTLAQESHMHTYKTFAARKKS